MWQCSRAAFDAQPPCSVVGLHLMKEARGFVNSYPFILAVPKRAWAATGFYAGIVERLAVHVDVIVTVPTCPALSRSVAFLINCRDVMKLCCHRELPLTSPLVTSSAMCIVLRLSCMYKQHSSPNCCIFPVSRQNR